MNEQSKQLEALVKQIGEAVLVSTETIDRVSQNLDTLAKQVQQQGYQIFALSDAVQTLAENHDAALERMGQVTSALDRLAVALETTDETPPPQA